MSAETVFRVCNLLASVSWLLLIILGWKRWVSGLITGVIVPLVLAVVYLALILSHWSEGQGSFNTLSGVAALFKNQWLLLAGWVHYLAFDLFIGNWQVRDALRQKIPHWAVIPCLVLTFLFGPIGLLLYFVLRGVLRRRLTVDEFATT
jgi:hypothetical protein